MTNGQFYYLILVCGAFTTFGVVLAINCIQYKAWLKQASGAAKQQTMSTEGHMHAANA